jgi:hypothetical protein
MHLCDKAEEIAMMSLSILYNTNHVPLIICAPPPLENFGEQKLGAEELQEENKFVPTRRKKRGRKVAHMVNIREVSTRTSSNKFVDPKDFSILCVWKERNDR